MGAEANPGEYGLANKFAKVYRKTFGKQKKNLVFQQKKQEKIPDWLAGKSYVDVTSDYEDVCDVIVNFKREIPDSIDIVYLCVFNDGEWRPIQWGRIKDSTAVFSDMGKDIAYLPALYLNAEIVSFGSPFILLTDCTQKILSAEETTVTLQLTSTTARKQEASTDGIAKTFLTLGKEYELFYWKDGWKSFGKSVADEKPLVFEKVPAGSLYWLVEKGSNKENERIFTIEDGKQVWW
jgi:hypothetical protein